MLSLLQDNIKLQKVDKKLTEVQLVDWTKPNTWSPILSTKVDLIVATDVIY